jgi:hypothetical protein
VNGIVVQETASTVIVEFEAVLDQDSHDSQVTLRQGERVQDQENRPSCLNFLPLGNRTG